MRFAYPDATWRPRPREPPVTTATLPSRRKMLPKSLSLTSCSADILIVLSGVSIRVGIARYRFSRDGKDCDNGRSKHSSLSTSGIVDGRTVRLKSCTARQRSFRSAKNDDLLLFGCRGIST